MLGLRAGKNKSSLDVSLDEKSMKERAYKSLADRFPKAWASNYQAEIVLKFLFALAFLYFGFLQIKFIETVTVQVGSGEWFIDTEVIKILVVGTFLEVFGILWLITKYLFGESNKLNHELYKKSMDEKPSSD